MSLGNTGVNIAQSSGFQGNATQNQTRESSLNRRKPPQQQMLVHNSMQQRVKGSQNSKSITNMPSSNSSNITPHGNVASYQPHHSQTIDHNSLPSQGQNALNRRANSNAPPAERRSPHKSKDSLQLKYTNGSYGKSGDLQQAPRHGNVVQGSRMNQFSNQANPHHHGNHGGMHQYHSLGSNIPSKQPQGHQPSLVSQSLDPMTLQLAKKKASEAEASRFKNIANRYSTN